MLKSPSHKSHSTEKQPQESYIQYQTYKIRRKPPQANSSFFEEDQIDQDETQPPQKFEEYMKIVTQLIQNPPKSLYLAEYYVVTLENDIINLVSETSPETLLDYLKLRAENNAPMGEEEIISLAWNILNGLKELQNLNFMYLSPSYILKQWKIQNFMELLLKQDIRSWLEQEDKLYLAPELSKYIEYELNDCDDFNANLNKDIIAPKAAIYSLGMILLQCIYNNLNKEQNVLELLRNPKYSWSLRELISQMLKEEDQRTSIDDLLMNPLFHHLIQKEKVNKKQFKMSLSVFLNLVKSNYHNIDWADEFFSIEEIISISDLKEGLYPIGELKAEINQQIQSIISQCNNINTVEELISGIAKIANHKEQKQDEEKGINQVIENKKQQFLFKNWFSKKPKQQNSNPELQEIVIAPQEPVQMAQVLLIKLLSTASEKAFKAFMQKYLNYMGNGLVWQNLRRIIWPRALGLESQEAQRIIVQLTLDLCDYLSEAKQKDMIQIEKDLARNRYSQKVNDCIKITLQGFVNQRHQNCYIQGMESISYVLLEAFNYDTELASICLNELYQKRIVQNYDLHEGEDCLKDSLNQKLQEKILLYKWLLNFMDPQLYSYLKDQDFKSETYVISWFTNFFSREFQVDDALRIYDYIIVGEEYFEIFLATTVMLELKSTFQIKDSEGILGCLKNLAHNISLDNCLITASRYSQEIQKTLITLAYQDEQVCKQMLEENEYMKERPWEHPLTWMQIEQKQIFEMTIFDLQALLKENHKNPFKVLPIDFRSAKDYEKACICNSLFAHYQNKKIHQQLIHYFELRGQVEEDQIYYIVIVHDYETQSDEEIVDYMLKLGVKKLCLLRGGIHSALMDGQEVIRLKNKAVLPAYVKAQIDEMKKKLIQQ